MAVLANFAKLVSAVLLLYQSPPPLYLSRHKPNGLGWLEEVVFELLEFWVLAANVSDDCPMQQMAKANVIAARSVMLFQE